MNITKRPLSPYQLNSGSLGWFPKRGKVKLFSMQSLTNICVLRGGRLFYCPWFWKILRKQGRLHGIKVIIVINGEARSFPCFTINVVMLLNLEHVDNQWGYFFSSRARISCSISVCTNWCMQKQKQISDRGKCLLLLSGHKVTPGALILVDSPPPVTINTLFEKLQCLRLVESKYWFAGGFLSRTRGELNNFSYCRQSHWDLLTRPTQKKWNRWLPSILAVFLRG